jgi:8-oxo-dGTP pyrophosphatase MutT (NUDIX family)
MRDWLVASGIVEGPEGILLVQNRRRDGMLDWSPPGGVIELDDGESALEGLTREVAEETGIVVTEWEGPIWEVEAEAVALDWRLRVEVHRAVSYGGRLSVSDPDGIVVAARFFSCDGCLEPLTGSWLPTREPFLAWLDERWTARRAYRYRIHGKDRAEMAIERVLD